MRFCWTGIAPARHCGRVALLLTFLSMWFMGTPALASAAIERIDVDRGRVTLRFSAPVAEASAFVVDAPRRIAIDLAGVRAGAGGGTDDDTVTAIRQGTREDGVRVVLDLARGAVVREGRFGADGRDLTLELATVDDAAFARAAAQRRVRFVGTPEWAMPPAAANSVRIAVPPVRRGLRLPEIEGVAGKPLVVIDAGHGGRDPGAIGPDGKREKDVTLRMARAIRDDLLRSGRVRVALTRDDDRFLVLRERYGLARRLGADLFISIHCDSVGAGQASGATVYTLSEVASDKESARLAARENKADIIGGIDLGEAGADVSSILIDLTQRETMNRSAQFAQLLGREAAPLMPFRANFHKMASLMVLKAPDMPSILFEIGYISNPADAAFIDSSDGRARVAQGVRRAVEVHFARRLNGGGAVGFAAR